MDFLLLGPAVGDLDNQVVPGLLVEAPDLDLLELELELLERRWRVMSWLLLVLRMKLHLPYLHRQ